MGSELELSNGIKPFDIMVTCQGLLNYVSLIFILGLLGSNRLARGHLKNFHPVLENV